MTRPTTLKFQTIMLPMLAGALIAACGEPRGGDWLPWLPATPSPRVIATPDPISLRLAEAAERASTALDQLASIEQVRTPGADLAPIVNASPGMRQPITLSWVGPVEPIAQRLAERARYSFGAIGNSPPTPVIVNLNVEQVPIIEVLRDIGLQVGTRATVLVDSRRQRVELRYEDAKPVE